MAVTQPELVRAALEGLAAAGERYSPATRGADRLGLGEPERHTGRRGRRRHRTRVEGPRLRADVGFVEIESDKGHDSFLLDVPEFLNTLKDYINNSYSNN